MYNLWKMGVVLCILSFFSLFTKGQYVETLDLDNGIIKDVAEDYNIQNNAPDLDQSVYIQEAIDNLAELGGGALKFPKGEYRFDGVYLHSNIHILIDAGTIIRPNWSPDTKVNVFILSVPWSKSEPTKYIENVSIRGVGGRFTVDYHDAILGEDGGTRAVLITMAKNFLIRDVDVLDNCTKFCGITLTPVKSYADYTPEDTKAWEVSRPTQGEIRYCRQFHAHPGYGLTQLHGAQTVHFEDIYSDGGVTLRLETGANTEQIGVYDVTGKRIFGENGRCALMLGPHSAKNGVVVVDSLFTKGCTYTVTIGMGGVKEEAPDQTPGYFSEGTKVSNVFAKFGETAQIKNQNILSIPEAYYDDLKLWPDNKFLTGPSITAMTNDSETYEVIIENVSMEGFTYNNDKPIMTQEDAREGNKWDEWDQWKTDYLDEEHRVQNGAIVEEYSAPETTFADEFMEYKPFSIDIPTNITNKKHYSISTYPNPAHTVLWIRSEEIKSYDVNIAVFDQTGTMCKCEHTQTTPQGEAQINVSDLNRGIYLLQVTRSDKKMFSQKVMIE